MYVHYVFRIFSNNTIHIVSTRIEKIAISRIDCVNALEPSMAIHSFRVGRYRNGGWGINKNKIWTEPLSVIVNLNQC